MGREKGGAWVTSLFGPRKVIPLRGYISVGNIWIRWEVYPHQEKGKGH